MTIEGFLIALALGGGIGAAITRKIQKRKILPLTQDLDYPFNSARTRETAKAIQKAL